MIIFAEYNDSGCWLDQGRYFVRNFPGIGKLNRHDCKQKLTSQGRIDYQLVE
ncbi:hypothetical protein [Sporomusa carbonis]|uniref:hypothetical protein n=1 Tax=Sporomusa carbonis TaxID=3076075 RepID=UPI003C7A61DD